MHVAKTPQARGQKQSTGCRLGVPGLPPWCRDVIHHLTADLLGLRQIEQPTAGLAEHNVAGVEMDQ